MTKAAENYKAWGGEMKAWSKDLWPRGNKAEQKNLASRASTALDENIETPQNAHYTQYTAS